MGRTLQPYSALIDHTAERFSKFRRALRKEDQEVLDRLMRFARRQLQAGVMAAAPNPFESMMLSMLIEQQKQMDQLEQRLNRFEPEQE